MDWATRSTAVIGLEARFVHFSCKAFDPNNPNAAAQSDVNRDGNFLQLAGTFLQLAGTFRW